MTAPSTVYRFPSTEMASPRLLSLPCHADSRGKLIALEAGRGLPFKLERAFFIYNVPPDAKRGGHTHHACHELLIPVSGSLVAWAGVRYFHLCDPAQGLYVPPGVTVSMENFSPDCVLLVLASEPYDENDK